MSVEDEDRGLAFVREFDGTATQRSAIRAGDRLKVLQVDLHQPDGWSGEVMLCITVRLPNGAEVSLADMGEVHYDPAENDEDVVHRVVERYAESHSAGNVMDAKEQLRRAGLIAEEKCR